MPGGLLQLVAYGSQDAILTLKPEFTYFKNVYHKYTNFSKKINEILPVKKSEFNSNNMFNISKNADLLNNLFIKIFLPSISVKYKNSITDEINNIISNIKFINYNEKRNLLNFYKTIVNFINKDNMYKDIIYYLDDNKDIKNAYTDIIYVNNILYKNLSQVNKTIFYKKDNNMLENKRDDGILFNYFNYDNSIEKSVNKDILYINYDRYLIELNDLNKYILLNGFYLNNSSCIYNYFEYKYVEYKFNLLDKLIKNLYLKLLDYYTNEDINIKSLYLITNFEGIDEDKHEIVKEQDFTIYNSKYLEINYLYDIDNFNEYLYNYNYIFLLDTISYMSKSIKSILIKRNKLIQDENNVLYEPLTNQFNIYQNFILSNYINLKNWQYSKNSYIVKSITLKNGNNDVYNIEVDNIQNLNINDKLFGIYYKQIYISNDESKNVLLGSTSIVENINYYKTTSDKTITFQTIDTGKFTITFNENWGDISTLFLIGDYININNIKNIYRIFLTKYSGSFYISNILNNVMTVFGNSDLFISSINDNLVCDGDTQIEIKKYDSFSYEEDFQIVSTGIDVTKHYILKTTDSIISSEESSFILRTTGNGKFSVELSNISSFLKVGNVIEIYLLKNDNNKWIDKYEGFWKVISIKGKNISLNGLSKKFILNNLDLVECNSNLVVNIKKWKNENILDIGTNIDCIFEIININTNQKNIECKLHDNKIYSENFYSSEKLSNYESDDFCYINNGTTTIDNIINFELIHSEVYNNYLFIKNSKYNNVNSLSNTVLSKKINTYSYDCVNFMLKLFENYIRNTFIDSFYVSVTYKVDVQTSIVQEYFDTFFYKNAFDNFINNFLIKDISKQEYYNMDSDDYYYNKFLNKVINYIIQEDESLISDNENVNNFQINIYKKFGSIFTKGLDSYQYVTNDDTYNDTINLLDKLNYLNTTPPFIFVRAISNKWYVNGSISTLSILTDDIVIAYSDINKTELICEFVVISVDNKTSEYNIKLALSNYNNSTNSYTLDTINNIVENVVLFLSTDTNYYISLSSSIFDETKFTFTFNSSVYLDYISNALGNVTYYDENSNTEEIESGDVIYIYYSQTEYFYEYHSTLFKKLVLDNIHFNGLNNEYIFLLDGTDDNDLILQTSSFTGTTYTYFAFKDNGNGGPNFSKGVKILTTLESPRYFNILSLNKIKSDGTYTELSLPSSIVNKHYHYCNISYNLLLMYIYNDVKLYTSSTFTKLILNRVFIIASKIYQFISNIGVFSDDDPESFVTTQKGVIRVTYYADFTKIFNSNTIINELFSTIPTDTYNYYKGIKSYLNGKTTINSEIYSLNTDGTILLRSDIEIRDSSLPEEIISYFKGIMSQFYNTDINLLSEIIGFEDKLEDYKQLFFFGALDAVSFEYINIINNYYYDNFNSSNTLTYTNIGHLLYEIINNSTFITSDIISTIIETKILYYSDSHEIEDFNIYLESLQNLQLEIDEKLTFFNNNVDNLNTIKNYNVDYEIDYSPLKLKNDIYDILSINIRDDTIFDEIISNVFSDNKVSKSIRYFLMKEIVKDNSIYSYINKFIFLVSIYQINNTSIDYFNNLIVNNNIVNNNEFVLFDESNSNILIPIKHLELINNTNNYIKSLQNLDDEKNIWLLEKDIYNHIKDYFFTKNNCYKSIELLEEYINSNVLLGNYKFKRGCIVNNFEYDSLNYKPYKIFIETNRYGNITSVSNPFNIIDLFISDNFNSIEFINPKLILNKVTSVDSKINIINDKNITNNITYQTSFNVPKNYEDILNTNVSLSFTLTSVVSNSVKQNLLIGFTRNNIEEIAALDLLMSSQYISSNNILPSTGYLMRLKNTNYFETIKDYLFCSIKLIENDSYYEIAFNAHDNYRLDYQSLKPYNEDNEYKICVLRDIYSNNNDTNGGYLLFEVIESGSNYIFKVKKRYIWNSNTNTYEEEENTSVLNYFLNLDTINSNKEFILSSNSFNFSVYEPSYNFNILNDNNPEEIDYFTNDLVSPSSIPSNVKDDIDNNLVSKYKLQLDSDVETNKAIDDIIDIVSSESNNIRYTKEFYLTLRNSLISNKNLSDDKFDLKLNEDTIPYVYFTNEKYNDIHHPFMIIASYGISPNISGLSDINKPSNLISNNNVEEISKEYDFYYGDVEVSVKGNFGNVSVYCFHHGYMGGKNLLTYNSSCSDNPNDNCLTSQTIVNVIYDNGNKYTFNNNANYNIQYGMFDNTYIFKNIPKSHPIAILNVQKENFISYKPLDIDPILIKVKGGNMNVNNLEDYFSFSDVNDNKITIINGVFKFMRGRTYRFADYGISSNHPFLIVKNNISSNSISEGEGGENFIDIKIESDFDVTNKIIYYRCKNHINMKANFNFLYKKVSEAKSYDSNNLAVRTSIRQNYIFKIPMLNYEEVTNYSENIMNNTLYDNYNDSTIEENSDNYSSIKATAVAINGVPCFSILNSDLNLTPETGEVGYNGASTNRNFEMSYRSDPYNAGNGVGLYNYSDYIDNLHPPLIGIGLDGFAIYGRYIEEFQNMNGYSLELDNFGGHNHDGYGYHYHSNSTNISTSNGTQYNLSKIGPNAWKGNINKIPYFWNGNEPNYNNRIIGALNRSDALFLGFEEFIDFSQETNISDISKNISNINLDINFGNNIKSSFDMTQGNIGITINGDFLRSSYENNVNDINRVDSIYEVEVDSISYFNFISNTTTDKEINIGDILYLYNSSLISSNLLISIVTVTEIKYNNLGEIKILFNTKYSNNLNEKTFAYYNVDIYQYSYGFKFKNVKYLNYQLNYVYNYNLLSQEEIDKHNLNYFESSNINLVNSQNLSATTATTASATITSAATTATTASATITSAATTAATTSATAVTTSATTSTVTASATASYSYRTTSQINNDIDFYTGNFIFNLDVNNNKYLNKSNFNGDYLRHPDGHSKIMAISSDGYPIYGPYGYLNKDKSNEVKLMKSSYKIKSNISKSRFDLLQYNKNNLYTFNIGSLIDDYEYVENLGDLDECNGRYCITPEFSNKTYAYFLSFSENDDKSLTPKYPYIIGNKFFSNPNMSLNVNTGINNLSNYTLNEEASILENNIIRFVSSNQNKNITFSTEDIGLFTIEFGSDFGNVSNVLFKNDIIEIKTISDPDNLLDNKFVGFWKILNIIDSKITCGGSISVFRGYKSITICTENPKILLLKYNYKKSTDLVINVNTNYNYKEGYILGDYSYINNSNYFISTNENNIILYTTNKKGEFSINFSEFFNIKDYLHINDVIEIVVNIDNNNLINKKFIGYWRVSLINNSNVTLVGSINEFNGEQKSIICDDNVCISVIKYDNAYTYNSTKNNNVSLLNTEQADILFENNTNVTFIGNTGKFGKGLIKENKNGLKYIEIIDRGYDYQNNSCIHLFKDIPDSLEYIDDYFLYLRRKTRFIDGYYYDYDDNKVKILEPNMESNETFERSIKDINDIVINFKDFLNEAKDPELNILSSNLINIINLDDFISVLGSILPIYFSNDFINILNQNLESENDIYYNVFMRKMIDKLFGYLDFKQNYKCYYNNDIYIEKNINIFSFINEMSNTNTLQLQNNSKITITDIEKNARINQMNNIIDNITKTYDNYLKFKKNKDIIYKREIRPKFAWIKNLGNFILDEIELYFNDLVIDKQYSDWINIWNQLNTKYDNIDLLNKLIGNIDSLIDINSEDKKEYTLIIPLRFWFCRQSGLNVPLIALQNTEINLRFKIRNINELIRKGDNVEIIQKGEIKTTLLADYIYLDVKERELFAKLRHEYLIEQTQFNGIKDIYNLKTLTKLSFKNCIKDIYYILRCSNNLIIKDRSNYSLNNDENSGNPITKSNIIINDVNILSQTGMYTNYIVPLESYNSTPSDGVNVIKFGLKSENIQPKGSINFSMLDNIYFDIQIDKSYLDNTNKKIYIYANSYNILRIMGGQAGLAYIQ